MKNFPDLARTAQPFEATKDFERLLNQITNGDLNAFEEFVEMFRPQIFKYATNLTSDHFVVEEIVQDTLMAVFQHAGKFQGDAASFTFWLRRILRNKLIDTYRFQNKFSYMLVEPQKLIYLKETLPQNDVLGLSEAIQRLYMTEILEQLAKCYREIVYFRYFEQMSLREISRVTMIPVNTVKSRLTIAKKKLAQIYAKDLCG
ncbi:MAG: RNA polymerase sigma factor [Firmicutes bacterium]|nr:RNA polymerase sigma factor [Bacillota bacterium]